MPRGRREFTPRGAGAAWLVNAALGSLSYLLTSGGFIVAGDSRTAMHLMIPALAGIVCGTFANRPVEGAWAAGVGVAVGALVSPPWFVHAPFALRPVLAIPYGLYAAGLAALVAALSRRGARTPLVLVGLALVLAHLWWTTAYVDGHRATTTTPTVFDYLHHVPARGSFEDDNGLYLRTYALMRQGRGYYEAFRRAYGDDAANGSDPPGVFGYRLPTLFLMWRLLPDAREFVWAIGVLVSGSALLAWWALRRFTSQSVALLSVTAFLVTMLWSMTSPMVLFTEPWAAPFAIGAIGAALLAHGSPHARGWTWTAAALALVAALIREHLVFLMLAGLAASAVRDPRPARAAPWCWALAAFVAVYVAHVIRIGWGPITQTPASLALWRQGGPGFVRRLALYGTSYFGGGEFLALALAVCGCLGIASAFRASPRLGVMFAVAIALPLILYLFVGGQASTADGQRLAPWGATVTPILYVSAAFLVRRAAPSDADAAQSLAARRRSTAAAARRAPWGLSSRYALRAPRMRRT